jgi:hypothetical protein
MMKPRAKKHRTVVYSPPQANLPYLVVTFTPDGGMEVVLSTNCRTEARHALSKHAVARPATEQEKFAGERAVRTNSGQVRT